ncbi:MAG: diaminopimelate epimerase [Candidatus Omnitrophica bacterium]|nr:diaminopimelate epimerase [Candidatus Omnitrophota bacterium]
MQNSKAQLMKYFLYSGTGNTFALIEVSKADQESKDFTDTAKELCEKHNVDGLLVMSTSDKAEIRMRIINRDGSEASMCGNGSRCAAHWAHHYAGLPGSFLMESGAGILKADVKDQIVKIRLTQPSAISEITQNLVPQGVGSTLLIDTGVPHAVTEITGIAAADINTLGSTVRNHPVFQPKGANATFFERGQNGIVCRVYERGVEGETQSCGTGSAAAALIASHKYKLLSPVKVRVQSGDDLSIYFETADYMTYENVDLEGAVALLSVEGEK